MRDRIEEALKHSKADYTEIRIEEKESTSVVYRNKDLETASSMIDKGGIVRCLQRKNGWGVATFNDLSDLRARVDQAYECARVGQADEPIELAPIPAQVEVINVHLQRDFRDVSLAEKKSIAEGYNQILRGYSGKIIDTQSVYADSFSHVTFASSHGTYIEEDRPAVTVVQVVMTREGDNVQSAHEAVSGPFGFEFAFGREDMAKMVAQRALDLLSAKSVVGGQYPVVTDPMLAGVFIHEAFGHLSEIRFRLRKSQSKRNDGPRQAVWKGYPQRVRRCHCA